MAEKIDWVYDECDGFKGAREDIFGYFRNQCIEKGEIEKSLEFDQRINQFKYEKACVFVCKAIYFDESRNVYMVEFFDAKFESIITKWYMDIIRKIGVGPCFPVDFIAVEL